MTETSDGRGAAVDLLGRRLSPEALAAQQAARSRALLKLVGERNPFYQRKFREAGFDPAGDPLAAAPLTTRGELQADQAAHPPYGTNLTYPRASYCRLHQTSGSQGVPLRWLDTEASWAWWRRCWQAVYAAAGVGADDRLVFTFSFGPFVGFWSAFEAAVELGWMCLAAGGMSTLARLEYLLTHEATIVCCTPTYALRLIEVAEEAGLKLADSAVRGLIVAGEPGGNVGPTRARIESGFGARVFDHAGMTEMGAWGFEPVDAPGGLHVLETEFVAEVLDPETGAATVDGAVGELVLTNLGRLGSPLIRYRTGDLVRPAGRDASAMTRFLRLEGGILGRADDMLIVRGNNIFPTAIEAVVRQFDEVAEFRLRCGQRGALSELTVELEPAVGADGVALARAIGAALRDRFHLTFPVRLAAAGTLPRYEMKARRLVREDRPDGAATEHPNPSGGRS